MVSQSLKKPSEATENPPTLYPHGISLDNYRALGNTGQFGIWQHVSNSLLVAAGTTLLTMLLATLAGYGFAKLRFRGSGVLFFIILATFMIPFQAIITPLFSILHGMGLSDTLLGTDTRLHDVPVAVRNLPDAQQLRLGAGQHRGSRSGRRVRPGQRDGPRSACRWQSQA